MLNCTAAALSMSICVPGSIGTAFASKSSRAFIMVIIAQPLEKVKLAASTVQDLAGNLSAKWCPAPLGNGRGAGGVAGGAGNDASCGVGGKVGAGLLRPLGGSQFSMSKRAVLTLVPWLAKVPAGRSSYHPPEFSARGFKVACRRGPFAQMATKRPPGFSIFIAC